jgi:AAA domain
VSDVIQLRPVDRALAKFVIVLASRTGDGKTYSALQLALGLAGGNPEKIALIDAENRRGSLYANVFAPKKFIIGDLMPPFSPERYSRALRQVGESGAEVAIVDSYTHSWNGEGGCEDIANRPKADGSPRKIADWITAKRENKKLVNTMLFLPMHVILCVRAQEKMDFRNPQEPISLGVQPICEKNLMFEATISYMLHKGGRERENLKPNREFDPLLAGGEYFTADHGKALRDWSGGFDAVEQARASLRLGASQGMEGLKTAWSLVPADQKKALTSFKDSLKELADHADSEARLAALAQEAEKKDEPIV